MGSHRVGHNRSDLAAAAAADTEGLREPRIPPGWEKLAARVD